MDESEKHFYYCASCFEKAIDPIRVMPPLVYYLKCFKLVKSEPTCHMGSVSVVLCRGLHEEPPLVKTESFDGSDHNDGSGDDDEYIESVKQKARGIYNSVIEARRQLMRDSIDSFMNCLRLEHKKLITERSLHCQISYNEHSDLTIERLFTQLEEIFKGMFDVERCYCNGPETICVCVKCKC